MSATLTVTADWEAELNRVAAHIAAAELRIRQQRMRIERLSCAGRATADAEKSLDLMLTILEMLKKHRIAIEWHLSDGVRH
jgi:hypothetical protein